jgi:hypothetical protein
MKRYLLLVAVGMIFATAVGCAHKKAKRYTSAYYGDCCSPCGCCDGLAGSAVGPVLPGPVVSTQAVGAVTPPIARNITPTSLDARSIAATAPTVLRR